MLEPTETFCRHLLRGQGAAERLQGCCHAITRQVEASEMDRDAGLCRKRLVGRHGLVRGHVLVGAVTGEPLLGPGEVGQAAPFPLEVCIVGTMAPCPARHKADFIRRESYGNLRPR